MNRKTKISILVMVLVITATITYFLLIERYVFTKNKLQYDPETKAYYVPGIVYITFKDSVSESAILEYLRERNLQILDKGQLYKNGPIFATIRVPVGREKEYRDDLKKSPLVETADLAYYTQVLD